MKGEEEGGGLRNKESRDYIGRKAKGSREEKQRGGGVGAYAYCLFVRKDGD